MKIKLEIELDLPDGCEELSDGELQEIVFDHYTNYVTKHHCIDAMQWCGKDEIISTVHSNWAAITSKASDSAKVIICR